MWVVWRRDVGRHHGAHPSHRADEKASRARALALEANTKNWTTHTRRETLSRSATLAGLLAGAGVWPAAVQAAWIQAAFEAKTLADAVRALGGSAPGESKDVPLTAPDIAENGAVVPLACACALPEIKRLLLLVEKNPNPLAAAFELSDSIDTNVASRVKMGATAAPIAPALGLSGAQNLRPQASPIELWLMPMVSLPPAPAPRTLLKSELPVTV
jgi:sulfur-oxidizing protein SoxY